MYALTKQPFDDDGPSESSTTVDPGVQTEDSKFLEDLKLSTDDEDEDVTEDVFNSIISCYMSKRNIINSEVSDPKHTNKAIIQYVNLKYIENNFRTIGLNKIFDKNNLMQAQMEFESFEKWFSCKNDDVAVKKYINDLRIPMFGHLYLSLYSEDNRECLLTFLNIFNYLFVSAKGIIFLKELKNVTSINNLSPYLSLFRKNKYLYSVSPEFLTCLYEFFQHHYILKLVFQEWFDINYSTTEDPKVVFESYYNNSASKMNNLAQSYAPKLSNNELKKDSSVTNDDLIKTVEIKLPIAVVIKLQNTMFNFQKIIDQEFQDSSSSESSNEQDQISNNGEIKPKKQRRKLRKNTGQNKRISNSSACSSKDTSDDSFSDEEITKRKYITNKNKSNQPLSYKTTWHMKTIYTTKIDVKNLKDDPHLSTMRQLTLLNCKKLSCAILTSDHKYVAAGSVDSLIYLWKRSYPSPPELGKNSCKLSDQNKNLIEYFDKSTASILRGHGGSIFDLAEISLAKVLLSASNDKTFRAWDLESKTCLEIYNEHEHRTWCIATCPYSLQVATGSCDGASCLWFLNYKRPLRVFMGHLDDILVIKFHPNQVLLATGSADKTIRVFELVTGECQRLLLGHSDYITCLEFNPGASNILASTCGNGEIIVWDIPSGEILWKLKVAKVLFSDLVWLTNDIILASLNTGIILKCDTKKEYINTPEKVEGFTTNFNRLMSLKQTDSILYTIGIPGKPTLPSTSSKKRIIRVKSEPQTSQHQQSEPSTFNKLFSKPHIIENNGNSVSSLFELNSAQMNLPTCDLQYQLNNNSKNSPQTSSDFLQMNLQHAPFNLTSDEITKLNSEHQSNNIRLIQKQSIKPIQKNFQITNSSSSQINVHSTSINTSQPLTNVNVPLKSQIKNIHQLNKNQLPTNKKFQHLQIQNPTVQTSNMDIHEQHQSQLQETNLSTNRFVQQQPILQYVLGNNIHKAKTGAQQQQKPQLQPVILPRPTLQQSQKNVLQQDPQKQSQRVGSHIKIARTNTPQLQQIRPNTPKAKINIRQRQQQQQTSVRLANVNVSQSINENTSKLNSQPSDLNTQHVSKPGLSLPHTSVPVRLGIKPQKTTIVAKPPTLEKMPAKDYVRLRQTVMASLLQTNPEMFTHGQTVIGEISRSQSTSQSVDTIESNLQTESQQNKNPQN